MLVHGPRGPGRIGLFRLRGGFFTSRSDLSKDSRPGVVLSYTGRTTGRLDLKTAVRDRMLGA